MLLWLPLGADGNPAVRWGGAGYEALVARREHRAPLALFHSALQVRLDGTTWVVEMAPAWGTPAGDRGVVGEGAVGLAPLGRSRLFRYEVRRWSHGVVPDAEQAVDGPVALTASEAGARTLLALVPECPRPVWGRDQLGAGEMWNSNSMVAWLLARSGLLGPQVRPPSGGRAPGWAAGVRVAGRQRSRAHGAGAAT
jgi:hypothetical protein